MSARIAPRLKCLLLVLLATPAFLFMVGCPHRSPVWSPDSKHILLLGRSSDEAVDRPAGGIWLVDAESRKVEALAAPAPGVLYLAAVWIDDRSFAAITAIVSGGEVKEGSETIWRGEVGRKGWTKLKGPEPSSERTPRRIPLVIPAGEEKALVYASGTEAVVAVSLADGKELLRVEPAELVGPGPGEGFLVTRAEAETGGLELVAIGASLKPLWSRRFSELSRDIAAKTGKKPTEIVINDTSTSFRAGNPPGSEVAVTLIYTDVSWREGISGYFVKLGAEKGALLAAASATALWGRPGVSDGMAWAIAPVPERGVDKAVIRSVPFGAAGEGTRLELPGVKRSSVIGYSVSPSGKEFGAVIAGEKLKLLLYPLAGQKIAGKPVEIDLGA